MTDIVERLRAWANSEVDTTTDALLEQANMAEEAADEIERLETKVAQTDRYIALLNDEIGDNGKLRDEIERLLAALNAIRIWIKNHDRSTDELRIVIAKAEGR